MTEEQESRQKMEWWGSRKEHRVFWQAGVADAEASARLAKEGRLSGRWQGQPNE